MNTLPVRLATTLLATLCLSFFVHSQEPLSAEDILGLESVGGVQLSPNGAEIIYAIYTPRGANDDPGGSKSKYYKMTLKDKTSSELFNDTLKASAPQYSPDGKQVGFLYKSKGEKKQVWAMSIETGEISQVTNSATDVLSYKWNPNGTGLAYISRDAVSDRQKELKKRGYDFIFYEENLRTNDLYTATLSDKGTAKFGKKLNESGHVWGYNFSPDGKQIAARISEKNLVDHNYMFSKVHVFDVESGKGKEVSQNAGKIGNYAISPDGTKLAYAAALDLNDHAVSQAFVVDIATGELKNWTPKDFKGHVTWVGWKDADELYYLAGEGVNTNFCVQSLKGGTRKVLINGGEVSMALRPPVYSKNNKQFVFSGSTVADRVNLYSWKGKGELTKLTDLNPEIAKRKMGKQEAYTYKARDGQEIEGLIIYPVDYNPASKYPLIVYVHGGPESHHSNAWNSYYHTPGQYMAGKGYMVTYLNYRASTGYGVEFAREGLGDPAGKEFDDIADAIDYLCDNKGADPDRVGMAGGSYGGYASAWFATKYTSKVRAVAMFVGISNLISKRGTTDIPYEEMYVHSGKALEEQWQMNLERSPIYWAHQSKTATLIYGGAADTRVHPSQSMELYRRMKVNNHPAVRLVQYPGEGHGNRKQVGQIDVLHRQVQWFDWYVRDKKPLNGEMPPLDISDAYGLDW